MKTKTVYIANDGSQFDSENDCLSYEKNLPKFKLITFIDNELNTNSSDFKTLRSFLYWLYKNQDIISEYYETKSDAIDLTLSKYFPDDETLDFSINDVLNIIDDEQSYLEHFYFKN